MLKRRTTLLGVSVLCVAILIMPYTVSLFSAQHDWQAAADVDCLNCHTDITEPGATYMHGSMTAGSGQEYCNECHQVGSSGTSDGVTGNGGYDDEHAAVTVECLDCHETNIGTVNDTWYSGTALEDALADGSKGYINNNSEAHSNMTGSASDSQGAWAVDYLAGNNEACIACHTNITVVTTYAYGADTMYINATESVWGNWTVDFETSAP